MNDNYSPTGEEDKHFGRFREICPSVKYADYLSMLCEHERNALKEQPITCWGERAQAQTEAANGLKHWCGQALYWQQEQLVDPYNLESMIELVTHRSRPIIWAILLGFHTLVQYRTSGKKVGVPGENHD